MHRRIAQLALFSACLAGANASAQTTYDWHTADTESPESYTCDGGNWRPQPGNTHLETHYESAQCLDTSVSGEGLEWVMTRLRELRAYKQSMFQACFYGRSGPDWDFTAETSPLEGKESPTPIPPADDYCGSGPAFIDDMTGELVETVDFPPSEKLQGTNFVVRWSHRGCGVDADVTGDATLECGGYPTCTVDGDCAAGQTCALVFGPAGTNSVCTCGVDGDCPAGVACTAGHCAVPADRLGAPTGQPLSCPPEACPPMPGCLRTPLPEDESADPPGVDVDGFNSCSSIAGLQDDDGLQIADISIDQLAQVYEEYMDEVFGGIVAAQAGASRMGPGDLACEDLLSDACAPRDPMYWQVLEPLRDVVKTWRDTRGLDLMLVIDRSGSMGDDFNGNGQFRLERALHAGAAYIDMLAGSILMGDPTARPDARVGLATFAKTSTTDIALEDVLELAPKVSVWRLWDGPMGRDSSTVNTDAISREESATFIAAMQALEDANGFDWDAAGVDDADITNALDSGRKFWEVLGQAEGSTSLGRGVDKALEQLCPSNNGDCSQDDTISRNKALLVLSDGAENFRRCMGRPVEDGDSCGGELLSEVEHPDGPLVWKDVCYDGDCIPSEISATAWGAGDLNYFRWDRFAELVQMCTIRVGSGVEINDATLEAMASYSAATVESPEDGRFFAANDEVDNSVIESFLKCYGNQENVFPGIDPNGRIEGQLSGEPIEYEACGDTSVQFAASWSEFPSQRGDIRMIVEDPEGNLVRPDADSRVTLGERHSTAHSSERLNGTWRAQVVTRHHRFVNGVTTDGYLDPMGDGVPLVRRQIHRLCPEGCDDVLYYETGTIGSSVYEMALDAEVAAGLIGSVTRPTTETGFATELAGDWDLIVYADQGDPLRLERDFDEALLAKMCLPVFNGGPQRAIITETRGLASEASIRLHACSGAFQNGTINLGTLQDVDGEGRLISGSIPLLNRGHLVFSYGVLGLEAEEILSNEDFVSHVPEVNAIYPGGSGAIVASTLPWPFDNDASNTPYEWKDQSYFIASYARGHSKIEPYLTRFDWNIGDRVTAGAAIVHNRMPAGGYEDVQAYVEVTYPTVGLGNNMLSVPAVPVPPPPPPPTETGPGQDPLSEREARVAVAPAIPYETAVFPLLDDGASPDIYDGDMRYRADISSVVGVDGTYRLRYVFELTANGCTTQREIEETFVVHVEPDPAASHRGCEDTIDGRRCIICPQDANGNMVGSGVTPTGVSCSGDASCDCDASDVTLRDDGCYEVAVTQDAGDSCTVTADGGDYDATEPLNGTSPTVTADDYSIARCVPASVPETIVASTDAGTLTGKIVAIDGQPLASPVVIDGADPTVALPSGVITIEWRAVNPGFGEDTETQVVTITQDDESSAACCAGKTQLNGNGWPNWLFSWFGPQCVFGRGGNDNISGILGPDYYSGGDGNDTITTGTSFDVAAGGAGNDLIILPPGWVEAYGGDGNDTITGITLTSNGDIWGNAGDDLMSDLWGNHPLYPGPGLDVILGGPGDETVFIFDVCELQPGEVLEGGFGNNTLYSPVSAAELATRGVFVANFNVVDVSALGIDNRHLSECYTP